MAVEVGLGSEPAFWPDGLFGQPDWRQGSTSSAASKPHTVCFYSHSPYAIIHTDYMRITFFVRTFWHRLLQMLQNEPLLRLKNNFTWTMLNILRTETWEETFTLRWTRYKQKLEMDEFSTHTRNLKCKWSLDKSKTRDCRHVRKGNTYYNSADILLCFLWYLLVQHYVHILPLRSLRKLQQTHRWQMIFKLTCNLTKPDSTIQQSHFQQISHQPHSSLPFP